MTLSKFYVLYNLIPIFILTLKQSFNKFEKHVSNVFVVNVCSTIFFSVKILVLFSNFLIAYLPIKKKFSS